MDGNYIKFLWVNRRGSKFWMQHAPHRAVGVEVIDRKEGPSEIYHN